MNTNISVKVEAEKEEEGELGAAVRRALGDGSKEAVEGSSRNMKYKYELKYGLKYKYKL